MINVNAEKPVTDGDPIASNRFPKLLGAAVATLLLMASGSGPLVGAQQVPVSVSYVGMAPMVKTSEYDGSSVVALFAIDASGIAKAATGAAQLALWVTAIDEDGNRVDSKLIAPLEIVDGFARLDLSDLAVGDSYRGTVIPASSESSDCANDALLCADEELGIGYVHFVDALFGWTPGVSIPAGSCVDYDPTFPSQGTRIRGSPIHSETTASVTNTATEAKGYAKAKGGAWNEARASVYGGWFDGSGTVNLGGDILDDGDSYVGSSFVGGGKAYGEAVFGTVVVDYNWNTGKYSIVKWALNAGWYSSRGTTGAIPASNPAFVEFAAQPGYDYNGQLWALAYADANGGESSQGIADADFKRMGFCIT